MSDDGVPPPDDGHAGDLVSAHLDGELDPATSAWVDQHLATCGDCRAVAGQAQLARAWVRALPDVDAGSVVEGLLARHRAVIRLGAAFVGMTAFVIGSFALTTAVIRTEVLPDVDDLVAAHEASARSGVPAGVGGAHEVDAVGRTYTAPPAMIGTRAQLSRRVLYDGHDMAMVVYGDGSITVSVFQQPGKLDWGGLPDGARVEIGDRRVWVTRGDGPEVLVTEIGHLVVTVVSEDPAAARTVVSGLDERSRGSLWDHVHDACSRFTEVFAAGG